MLQPANLIALLTDFGLDDPYVGQMKGAILCRNPAAQIVDICHAIPRHDILAAAVALHASRASFPAGTVHLIVVDPGVGSQRRIIAAASAAQLFIGPDNGIFSLLLRDNILEQVRLLENPALAAAAVSPVFHGRDLMAPAAAALAGGFPFAELGPIVPAADCVLLDLPRPLIAADHIEGQVLQIDHFGNIRTNVTKIDADILLARSGAIKVKIREQVVPFGRVYADALSGSLIALIDSAGYLEIAMNQGNAARFAQCWPGDPVIVLPRQA